MKYTARRRIGQRQNSWWFDIDNIHAAECNAFKPRNVLSSAQPSVAGDERPGNHMYSLIQEVLAVIVGQLLTANDTM